jgi:rhodanese-related sulfurtransferase
MQKTRKISAEEAKTLLEQNKNILLLDVRTPEEYRSVHIPGSTLLPLNDLQDNIQKYAPEKDRPILIYCLSGARADTACRILAGMGYTDVVSMGGIRSWKYKLEGTGR